MPPSARRLFAHTDGHPLFTVELLRNLRERGNLVKDKEGYWIQGSTLDWGTLPAHVEGVIGERIARLPEGLHETLTTASVMGYEFTAQVIARVQKLRGARTGQRICRVNWRNAIFWCSNKVK